MTPTRDRDAAEAFLHKAIRTPGLPEKITIDWSGANTAAITHYNHTHKAAIVIRHCKYLNNIVEQDHRGETAHASHARVQVLLGGALYDRRHGSHARPSPGATRDHRDPATNADGAGLRLGCVDNKK
jgi:DDE domain